MSKYKELIKNTGILAISQFSSKILIFLLVPLYTNVLTTAEYGVYDLVQSTIQVMIPLLTLNIIDAVMRFLMDKEIDHSVVITIGLKYLLIGSSLSITAMILIRVIGLFPIIEEMTGLILLYSIVSMLQQFLVQAAKGLDFVKQMGIAGVIGTTITILACIICLLVFDLKLKGFFIANILGQAIPSLYLIIRMKLWTYITPNQNHLCSKCIHKEMLLYCVPLLTNTLGWLSNTYLNKYVVAIMLGESANGLLGVAYKIPTILVTLQSIFNQAWQISAVKEYEEDKETDFYCNIFTMMNLVMCLSCSGLIVMIKIIANILFGNDFFVAWQFVPLLLVSGVINAIAGVIGAILGAKKDTRTMAIAGLAGIVVNAALSILLINKVGIHGVSIAVVLSSFTIYIVRQIAVRNIFSKSIILKTLVSWGLLMVQSAVAIQFQSVLGYMIQIAIVALIVVNNLKYIKKIVAITRRLISKKE